MQDRIIELASQFRAAIDAAQAEGEFERDVAFSHFPRGCCGDAMDLLGEFLLENDIESIYVCGNHYYDNIEEGTQSHAWLLIDNLIVDITRDQFQTDDTYYKYDKSVYVGGGDAFHDLFEVEEGDVHICQGLREYNGMCIDRMYELYRKIKKYI